MKLDKYSKIVFFSSLFLLVLLVLGCSEGIESSSPVSVTSPLSPTISKLVVSGNTISKKSGGILKISCTWTSPEAVSSATGYLSYVQNLNASNSGATGIIGPSGTTGSGTTTATAATKVGIFIPPNPPFNDILFQATASGTATDTSPASGTASGTPSGTASGTVASSTASSTVATDSGNASGSSTTTARSTPGDSIFQNPDTPLSIPTGVATSQLAGNWNVEIPFPISSVSNASIGKKQMLFWMILNNKKTNTLAFEIDITQ